MTAPTAERTGAELEQQHLADDYFDAKFAKLAAEHPEGCPTDADYPDWTPGGAS